MDYIYWDLNINETMVKHQKLFHYTHLNKKKITSSYWQDKYNAANETNSKLD